VSCADHRLDVLGVWWGPGVPDADRDWWRWACTCGRASWAEDARAAALAWAAHVEAAVDGTRADR